MRFRSLLVMVPVCLLVLAGLLPAGLRASGTGFIYSKAADGKQVYTGTAIGIGGQLGHVSIPFTLEIDGETPQDQVQRYRQTLETKGPAELLQAISGRKLGTFTLEGTPPHDLNFVQVRPQEKGHSITALSERWVHVFELSNATKLKDYPFTYIQLFINDDGKGEGSLVTAAKINLNDDIADVQEFGSFPAHLEGVQRK